MTALRLAAAAATVVILSCGAAAAQIVAPREAAQIELGPLSIYPSLRLVDAGKDENIFNDAEDPQEDYTFTLASRALAVLRLASNELMFSTGNDYVWFKEHASERSSNATYALRFNLSASRFRPYVGAEHTRTRLRPTPEIDARARRTERTLLAGTAFNLTERTALAGVAQWGRTAYDEGEAFRGVELANPLNRTSRSYSAGFRYAVTPLTTISAMGNYREDAFAHSALRNAKAYSVTPVVEFEPEAAIRGTFRAGYEVFTPEDPALSERRGLILEGNVNWAIMERTLFEAIVGRNMNYSYLDAEPYFLQTGGRLQVTHRLIGPLSVQAAGERQRLSYRSRSGSGDGRADTSDTYGGGIIISLGRGFAAYLGAEKTERRSPEDPRQNYNRTRVLSSITIGQ